MPASRIFTIVDGRPRNVGDFQVRRVLPSRAFRLIGPFIFLDHMGPLTLPPGKGVDVLPHPHIGLATVTYLFQGELIHRDSLGSHQPIRPGEINWMTAGRGIVHSERTNEEFRRAGSMSDERNDEITVRCLRARVIATFRRRSPPSWLIGPNR